MEQRLSFVTLGVKDVTRSQKFYEALGWRPAKTVEGEVAFFAMNGLVFALWGERALAEDAATAYAPPSFRGVALAHNGRSREEVDSILAEAQRLGGRVTKAAKPTEWGGYAGYFADPDGHLWEIAWNPGMPLDEHGFVKIDI
jgi:predicted lactoylglutathione lyase